FVTADEILRLSWQHIQLTLICVLIASAIGIPLGIAAHRVNVLRHFVLGFSSVVQTTPSLALFGFLIPFIGIGERTALVALILYALLPIVRNTFAGLQNVDPGAVEVATAMGLTPAQTLRLIELPLAAPSIFAGTRIAAVTTVGTATIAAAIGAGGLGVFIFRGIASVETRLLLAGSVPAAVIALVLDGGLGWIEKRLSRY
ncbi:MAG TPA: ABC transporter permease, partial [Bryobacteraceae bacterium]|nr:ABC transporter permease [Bryobacteraceae bacterium]